MTEADRCELKKLLTEECTYKLRDEVMDKFLDGATELHLNSGDVLIHAGQYDPNIYIVKSGIIRDSYLNGDKEITRTFALPPTMFMEYHSYYAHQPSFYQLEACCESIVLKITKSYYDNMIAQYHEFAQWVISMNANSYYFLEKKDSVINGNAKERFKSIILNRPEIMQKVKLKIIASYLGITQQYLSKLKNEKNGMI